MTCYVTHHIPVTSVARLCAIDLANRSRHITSLSCASHATTSLPGGNFGLRLQNRPHLEHLNHVSKSRVSCNIRIDAAGGMCIERADPVDRLARHGIGLLQVRFDSKFTSSVFVRVPEALARVDR